MAYERNPTRDDGSIPSPSAVDIIARLGKHASGCHTFDVSTEGLGEGLPERVPVLFNKASGRVESLKTAIEEFRESPARNKGTANVETLVAFNDLVNRHKLPNSAIFASTAIDAPALTAVIDYLAPAGSENARPQWAQHRVRYAFPQTAEFKAWVKNNGKPMEQGDFAAFVEEHLADLAEPTTEERQTYEALFGEKFALPSDIMVLSRGLEISVGSKVKTHTRLQSGERSIVFETEHTNGRGEPVEVPGIFMVSVPAWIDGEALRIPARLRYRVKAGEISWLYQLYRVEFFLRERVVSDLALATAATSLPGYLATPEA